MAREHTRTYFLAKLATELEFRGLSAFLRDDPPSLRVGGPGLLTETVDCVPVEAGWFYRWSWGEVVESTTNPAEAADRIAMILRPLG
ncbi:hypothetical protein OIE66_14460 [Nonomuraea sp. NBC_01738]|uniref:hypothetical protein n=1 Tax=Nonomuraea sp. NBC_01738 TaxID=2976003 RepID=UPI002E157ADF|nr:hypothetical protein OIE66_14460 [Nonomuraea sp. NBC_01738]